MTAPEMTKAFDLASSTISYYSGTVALNLYDSKDSGDWHSSIAVKSIETGQSKSPFFIINNNAKLNTIDYLGLDGIVDYSKEIIQMGIKNFNNVFVAPEPTLIRPRDIRYYMLECD